MCNMAQNCLEFLNSGELISYQFSNTFPCAENSTHKDWNLIYFLYLHSNFFWKFFVKNWLEYPGNPQCMSARKPANHEMKVTFSRDTAVLRPCGSAIQKFVLTRIDNGQITMARFQSMRPLTCTWIISSQFLRKKKCNRTC